jgi:hypothetical protein
MKRYVALKVIWVMGIVFLPAQAQQIPSACPVGINPLQLLVGDWTYSFQGSTAASTSFSSPGPMSAAGILSATLGRSRDGATTIGALSVKQTSSLNGLPILQESDSGTFQLFSDCKGGTLTLNLSSHPVSFDFYFVSTCEIALTGTRAGTTLTGRATKQNCGAFPLGAVRCETYSSALLCSLTIPTIDGRPSSTADFPFGCTVCFLTVK